MTVKRVESILQLRTQGELAALHRLFAFYLTFRCKHRGLHGITLAKYWKTYEDGQRFDTCTAAAGAFWGNPSCVWVSPQKWTLSVGRPVSASPLVTSSVCTACTPLCPPAPEWTKRCPRSCWTTSWRACRWTTTSVCGWCCPTGRLSTRALTALGPQPRPPPPPTTCAQTWTRPSQSRVMFLVQKKLTTMMWWTALPSFTPSQCGDRGR